MRNPAQSRCRWSLTGPRARPQVGKGRRKARPRVFQPVVPLPGNGAPARAWCGKTHAGAELLLPRSRSKGLQDRPPSRLPCRATQGRAALGAGHPSVHPSPSSQEAERHRAVAPCSNSTARARRAWSAALRRSEAVSPSSPEKIHYSCASAWRSGRPVAGIDTWVLQRRL